MPQQISESNMRISHRRGFILYIVITVLLGLAIMAFALNTFKTGAVTQLSRNVDQNRLALLAQSANAEVIAMLKSHVNLNPSSQIFTRFRSVFPTETNPNPTLPFTVDIIPVFEPQTTVQLAKVGYNLKIRSSAVLTVYRRSIYKSMSAYNGYIDIVSKAWREGAGEITMEAHERRDVRLVDLRHTLDKYALFVKNYSNDYNSTSPTPDPNPPDEYDNTIRRMIIEGVNGMGSHDISRVFIGTDNYPDCADPRKDIFFDLFYPEHKDLKGFTEIFGGNQLASFPFAPETPTSYPVFNRLFYRSKNEFTNLGGVSVNMFIKNKQVMNEYERVINLAADACKVQAGVATEPYMVAGALKDKCGRSIAKLNNPNAYSQMMCQDFYDNADGDDYSDCEEFKKLLVTCQQNWIYRWGYTDAASLWKIDLAGRAPRTITLPERYAGLSNISMGSGNYGPYMAEYREQKDGKPYNPERARVGAMQSFYGPDNDIPVLIEGKAYLRFFKIAYLDEFTATVPFVQPAPVNIRVITNTFLRKDKRDDTGSYLLEPLGVNLAPNLFGDSLMKSRAIDTLSANVLWGDKIKCYDGDGQEIEFDPLANPTSVIEKPAQPSGSNVAATRFGRAVDFKNASWNYISAQDFLDERAPGDGKLLYLDGFMYIMAGDLDLSKVTHFQGKGLIYIARGNCKLGSIERLNAKPTSDSLRIYLRQGDFIISSPDEEVFIEASLAALYDDPQGSDDPLQQGSIILNNRKLVKIYGNLLVDSLDLEVSGGSALADGGVLHIIHDPGIYNAAATLDSTELDPYHISIGPVKTSFAYRAGGEES
ncbi:MAG: hypothetical protein GQF41_3548 [Candidatus Rifleibacterium amylolyticum]|nr:MAG: hypothetical protein GQF41_3548 [Candidatus Rifleibacterium amylolyticum]